MCKMTSAIFECTWFIVNNTVWVTHTVSGRQRAKNIKNIYAQTYLLRYCEMHFNTRTRPKEHKYFVPARHERTPHNNDAIKKYIVRVGAEFCTNPHNIKEMKRFLRGIQSICFALG